MSTSPFYATAPVFESQLPAVDQETDHVAWMLSTNVTVTGQDSGIIATQGGLFGGWALYFDKGKPVFSYTFADGSNHRITSTKAVPAGKHNIVMDFVYDGGGLGKGGTATVRVSNEVYAKGRVEKTAPLRFSTEETLDFGVAHPGGLFTGRVDLCPGILTRVVGPYLPVWGGQRRSAPPSYPGPCDLTQPPKRNVRSVVPSESGSTHAQKALLGLRRLLCGHKHHRISHCGISTPGWS